MDSKERVHSFFHFFAQILYINARCKQILNLLLSQTKYITTEQIAAQMKVSKRTVYYDICKINLWLEQYGLKLEYQPKRGYGLTGDSMRIRALFIHLNTSMYRYKFGVQIGNVWNY